MSPSVLSCLGSRWEKAASWLSVANVAAAHEAFGSQPPFNVSQQDRAPLGVFREALGCGTMRIAGNGGWYWEVNGLADQRERIVPFFERFPLVGQKAEDFELYRQAVGLLSQPVLSDADYRAVLALRERMNRDGKRKYRMAGILRDYTPTSLREQGEMR